MSDINSVVLVGRLTADCKSKTMPDSGNVLLYFTVANGESRKNQQGEWEDVSSFFDCSYFTKNEKLFQRLVKGTQVTITGRLVQQKWQDRQTGENRSKIGIRVSALTAPYDSTKKTEEAPSANPQGSGGYRMAQTQKQDDPSKYQVGPEQYNDDEVPF